MVKFCAATYLQGLREQSDKIPRSSSTKLSLPGGAAAMRKGPKLEDGLRPQSRRDSKHLSEPLLESRKTDEPLEYISENQVVRSPENYQA